MFLRFGSFDLSSVAYTPALICRSKYEAVGTTTSNPLEPARSLVSSVSLVSKYEALTLMPVCFSKSDSVFGAR